jgi:dipeptidyl aminopeptidase/acylaminoacyl peptidase
MTGCATNVGNILEYQCRYVVGRNEEWSEEDRKRIFAEKMAHWKAVAEEEKRGHHFNYFLEYEPLQTARKVFCPGLILHGDPDAAVPVLHALQLAKVIRDSSK